jgi:hypothetical protein
MAYTGLPGITTTEVDNSQINVVDNSTVIATVGLARKGIVNSKVLVRSEQELISKFGSPLVSGGIPSSQVIDYGIYAARESLKETTNVYFVRATNGTEVYSGVGISGTSATSATSVSLPITALATSAVTSTYPEGYSNNDIGDFTSITTSLDVHANAPGVWGNDIAISVITPAMTASAGTSALVDWKYKYDEENNVSAANAKWKSIFKINVYVKNTSDTFGALWSSISANPNESFYVSHDYTVLDNSGNSLFVEEVVNGNSQYIYVKSNAIMPAYTSSYFQLSGGVNTSYVAAAQASYEAAWRFYSNKSSQTIDIFNVTPCNGLVSGTSVTAGLASVVDSVISQRMDVFAVSNVGKVSDVTKANILAADFAGLGSGTVSNPSYWGKYVGWQQVLDPYNSVRVWLPNSIFAASVIARTDRVANRWDAPAGTDFGGVPAAKQNISLSDADMGDLYACYNINSVKRIAGVQYIWGQKTAQLKNTARDRINVRRMLLYVERNVENILASFLFKGNSAKTRERVASLINNFMSAVKTGEGVQSFRPVVDDSNNTETTIAQNILNADLYIQPTYAIEYINLKVIITADSVTVSE